MPDSDPEWKIIGPGGGGATFFPTFHPTDPQRIAIRCDMTGLYLSSDGGESWTQHNLTSTVNAFAFGPGNKDVVYAGTRGLFRTDDFGKTWQRLFPAEAETEGICYSSDHADLQFKLEPDSVYPSGRGSVLAILLHPDDPSTIYVGVGSREGALLCISTDRGVTWRRAASFDEPVFGLFCAPSKPKAVYAVTSDTVYELTPEGDITDRRPLPDDVSPAQRVSAGWDDGNRALRIYAVSGAAGRDRLFRSGRGYVSHDAGRTWERFDDRVAGLSSVVAEDVGLSFACVATSPRRSRTAYVVCDRFKDTNSEGEVGTWYGILKTTDGGAAWSWVFKEGGGSGGYNIQDGYVAENQKDSWSTVAFGGSHVRVIDVGVFAADPEVAAFTDWYRAMKTVDGGKFWTALYSRTLPDGSIKSRGLDVTTTYGVHFDPFDPDHFAVSYTDIGYWHTFNRGKTWRRSVEGVPLSWINTSYWVVFDPEVQDKLWSVWSGFHDLPKLKMTRNAGWKTRATGGVTVSADGGRTWKNTSGGLPDAPATCLILDPASPAGNRTLYAAVYGKGVYKSTDDGKRWTLKNNGIAQDCPNTWELVYGADGTLYLVVAFDVVHNDGKGGRKLVDGAVYRSTDGAQSWQPVALPAGVRFPNSLAPDPEVADRLYLCLWSSVTVRDYGGTPKDGQEEEASRGGMLRSEDGGRTWKQVFDPDAYVYGAAVDPRRPGRVHLVTFHHTAHISDDGGDTWKRMKGYDFHWGHRPVIDPHDPERIYITTFGSSVWHGRPVGEG